MSEVNHTSEGQSFKEGDRVIYAQLERRMGIRTLVDWPATYVRSQVTSGRLMHIIELDDRPGRPRQVGELSIRLA